MGAMIQNVIVTMAALGAAGFVVQKTFGWPIRRRANRGCPSCQADAPCEPRAAEPVNVQFFSSSNALKRK